MYLPVNISALSYYITSCWEYIKHNIMACFWGFWNDVGTQLGCTATLNEKLEKSTFFFLLNCSELSASLSSAQTLYGGILCVLTRARPNKFFNCGVFSTNCMNLVHFLPLQLRISSLFKNVDLHLLQPMSLTLMQSSKPLANDSTISLDPMEISTFRIKLR